MKLFLVAFSALITSLSFSQTKMTFSSNMFAVLNEEEKVITVHDYDSLNLLARFNVDHGSPREIALCQGDSLLWYHVGGMVYASSTSDFQIRHKFQGIGVYDFNLIPEENVLIHYSVDYDEQGSVKIYDLSTGEEEHSFDVDFNNFMESTYYDRDEQRFYMMCAKQKTRLEEPAESVSFPENGQDIVETMLHDGFETRFIAYDLSGKKPVKAQDRTLFYSSGFSAELCMLQNRLFVCSQMGLCQMGPDFDPEMYDFMETNVNDFALNDNSFFYSNGFGFGKFSIQTDLKGNHIAFDSDKTNQALFDAQALGFMRDQLFCLEGNKLSVFEMTNLIEPKQVFDFKKAK